MARGPVEEKICTVSGCDRTLYAKGLCGRHYQQMRRSNGKKSPADIISSPLDRFDNPDPICQEPGCSRTRVTAQYCNLHQQRKRDGYSGKAEKEVKICSVGGCNNHARTRGMCNKHYQAWFRANSNDNGGQLPVSLRKGDKSGVG